MPDDELDPGASTQKFQAFMDRRDDPEPSGARGVTIALAVVAVVVLLVLAWLVFGR